jgi:actin-related protein 8
MDVDDEGGEDVNAPTGESQLGSKTIIIHVGSQNLRIGFASDALPKTVPMCIARKWKESESEADGAVPKPKRAEAEDGEKVDPEELFGEEVNGNVLPSIHIRSLTRNEVCFHLRPDVLGS